MFISHFIDGFTLKLFCYVHTLSRLRTIFKEWIFFPHNLFWRQRLDVVFDSGSIKTMLSEIRIWHVVKLNCVAVSEVYKLTVWVLVPLVHSSSIGGCLLEVKLWCTPAVVIDEVCLINLCGFICYKKWAPGCLSTLYIYFRKYVLSK